MRGRGDRKTIAQCEKTQVFSCIIRCETVRFRLQKNRNGGQLWVVNVSNYTIHDQTDCWQSRSLLLFSTFFPLLLWRFLRSLLFCVHYTRILSQTGEACAIIRTMTSTAAPTRPVPCDGIASGITHANTRFTPSQHFHSISTCWRAAILVP
jgi:hypothetical protein